METMETEEIKHTGSASFKKLALPCLIYTVIYAVCMYDNGSAVTMPVWIAALAGLVVYEVKASGRDLKKGSRFYIIFMLLIGLSTVFTANDYIIACNYIAEFLLLVTLVLLNYADVRGWDLGRHLGEICRAVFGALGRIFRPFIDCSDYMKEQKGDGKNSKARPILFGILIAIPCLLILGALLTSADMIFEDLVDSCFKEISLPDNFFGVAFMLVFGFWSAYCGLAYAQEKGSSLTLHDMRRGNSLTAVTVTGLITVMYLVFSVIQILYLFIGRFTLPDGVTYAEYARSGFFELMTVCVINLIIVLAAKKYFIRSRLLDAILLVISGCTYIMIASSAIRMIMYIEAYRLTFERVLVLVILFTVAILMAGVIILTVGEKLDFFRFATVTVCIIYTLLAFSHADYFIAKYNISNGGYSTSGSSSDIDFGYIAQASEDAIPAVTEYLDEQGLSIQERNSLSWYTEAVDYHLDAIGEAHSIRKFNLSRYLAGRSLELY